jgi:hypothetical protein
MLKMYGSKVVLQYCGTGTPRYRVVIRKDGHNIQRLYWAGSLQETRGLARKIACKYAADDLRIFELGGDEVCFEQRPFGGASEKPLRR